MKSIKIPSVKTTAFRSNSNLILSSVKFNSQRNINSSHFNASSSLKTVRLFSSAKHHGPKPGELTAAQRKEKMEDMAKLYFENDNNQANLRTFDGILHGAKIKHADVEKGQVVVELKIGQNHVNIKNTMHGGCSCLLVDNVGTLAVRLADPYGRSGVSTDLNVSFFLALNLGETILIDAKIIKTGKSLAFVTVDIFNPYGALAAQGRMTKALGPIPTPDK